VSEESKESEQGREESEQGREESAFGIIIKPPVVTSLLFIVVWCHAFWAQVLYIE
jgi:hypothetical protein